MTLLKEILIPLLEENMECAILIRWLVKNGDRVEMGMPIYELETNDRIYEIENFDAGDISLSGKEGVTYRVGDVIGTVSAEESNQVPSAVSPIDPGAAPLNVGVRRISTPFNASIVGSWLITKSSRPQLNARAVYHFTVAGQCYWEMDHDGQRILAPIRYRLTGSTLTLIYSSGTEHDFELSLEEDGAVCIPSPNGTLWWMVRLEKPETYSKAFVDEHGQLHNV
jgi:pyruvate/2-oxoglutarate dehydrogenase complex dihydrolipoamide acyltransferase (E2) component